MSASTGRNIIKPGPWEMGLVIMMKIRKTIYILTGVYVMLAVSACSDGKRKFVWHPEVAEKTGKNLERWLRQAPFTNAMSGKGLIITNIEQVFPFYRGFMNENDNFNDDIIEFDPEGDIYQQESIFYKDPSWGDLFVYGALLYDDQELYLRDYYSTRGSVLIKGERAMDEHYSATLQETLLTAKTANYKAAIYWVDRNFEERVWTGFYQQKQLILQFAFPCKVSSAEKCLAKLKEINTALKLNVSEWANATPERMAIVASPNTFWRNPYITLYERLLSYVKIKLAHTGFTHHADSIAKKHGVDYLFGFESKYGKSVLTTKMVPTALPMDDYMKQAQAPRVIALKGDFQKRKVFVTEQTMNGMRNGRAEVYYRDNQILHMAYQVPVDDKQVSLWIEEILANLKLF